MKPRTLLFALLSAVAFNGCVGGRSFEVAVPYYPLHGSHLRSYSGPGEDSGVGPITQAGSDAVSAATNDQSNQDIQDAAAIPSAASAAQ